MTDLSDLLLHRPFTDPTGRWLLFFFFYLHFAFILILIGTAIIGVHHFLHSFWTSENFELRWDKKILKKFIIPKAIGVALGTIVLVVIQTYYAVPFFTAISMFAPFWLIAIPIMIFGFFFVDGISHKLEVHPYVSLVLGIIGLFLVLAIPAIFVAILITTENSDKWIDITQRDFGFSGQLLLHWLFRYLHVIGAGIVFGAVFQYFVTAGTHEYRQRILVRWILIGLLVQFVIGGLLAITLQEWLSLYVLLPLFVGILSAVILVGILYARVATGKIPQLGWATVVLSGILLTGMLLARQYIQQQKVLPLLSKIDANANKWRDRLEPMRQLQANVFANKLITVRDDGQEIYMQSCSFCHGRTGMGDGQERGNLITPPERLVYLRADANYISNILKTGVPGTAMPYFTIYEKQRFHKLKEYIGNSFGIFGYPEKSPIVPNAQAMAQAKNYFNTTCSMCHGLNGHGDGEYSRGLAPHPPDFHKYGIIPQRAFEVIRDGYPGTAMPSFERLEPMIRWGLVEHVMSFRIQQTQAKQVQ